MRIRILKLAEGLPQTFAQSRLILGPKMPMTDHAKHEGNSWWKIRRAEVNGPVHATTQP